MSLKVPKANNLQLFKEGYKHLQGIEEAVLRNIQAVAELSDLVKTSFGPNGMVLSASHHQSLRALTIALRLNAARQEQTDYQPSRSTFRYF